MFCNELLEQYVNFSNESLEYADDIIGKNNHLNKLIIYTLITLGDIFKCRNSAIHTLSSWWPTTVVDSGVSWR